MDLKDITLFLPMILIIIGIVDILCSRSNKFVRLYNRIDNFLWGRIIRKKISDDYIKKQMFYGGIGITIIGIIAQIYFLME